MLCLLCSCADEENQLNRILSEQSTNIEADEPYLIFSHILAKSLIDEEVRTFLKNEALKKLSGDFDVLYHMVKNKIVNARGETFEQVLQKYNQYDTSLSELTKELYKLNIRIPYLTLAHPRDWDTKNFIPNVVCNLSEPSIHLISIDAYGDESKVSAFEEPFQTTLVVGENRRLQDFQLLKSSTHEISYNFISSVKLDFSKKVDLKQISKLKSAGNRYNVYYPNGDLNQNVRETISAFRFRNFASLTVAADNWAELSNFSLAWHKGMLQIQITAVYGGSSPKGFSSNTVFIDIPAPYARISAFNDKKGFISSYSLSNFGPYRKVLKDLLEQIYTDVVSSKMKEINGKNYFPVEGVYFINWSPARYGDALKLIFEEYDDGAFTKRVVEHEVGFNSEFNFPAGDPWFDPAITGKRSGSVEVVTTDKSDPLGDIIISYENNFSIPKSTSKVEFILEPINR